MRGYDYEDEVNELCHLCVARNKHQAEWVAEYQAMLDSFIAEDWNKRWAGCEFAKSIIGNMFCNLIRENGGIPNLGKIKS